MQTDMHYYGTYALARAAGFKDSVAVVIATSSEYVDDSDHVRVTCLDGFEIVAQATAHHPISFVNADPIDQRRTWVPFHFIPGLSGESIDEMLVCVTDSDAAKAVVSNAMSNLSGDSRFFLLGILAHSYADTFSYYGFSGLGSSLNHVVDGSLQLHCSPPKIESLKEKAVDFFEKYILPIGANDALGLGHGSVATYPDQPYLSWEFTYESPKRASPRRENQITFLAACGALHGVFTTAAGLVDDDYLDPTAAKPFSDLEPTIEAILALEGDSDARSAAWQRAASDGALFNPGGSIPVYDSTRFTTDLRSLNTYTRKQAEQTWVYQFLLAADIHRNFILNTLLPQHGIKIENVAVKWHS